MPVDKPCVNLSMKADRAIVTFRCANGNGVVQHAFAAGDGAT